MNPQSVRLSDINLLQIVWICTFAVLMPWLLGKSFDADKGVWRLATDSPHVSGACPVEVLVPDGYPAGKRHRVLYVLPVEPGTGAHFGDGLQQIRKLNVHNDYQLICVQPTFDTTPWYGNHASDPRIQHERHLLEVVVPLIDASFVTTGSAEERLLLGYSKSGWGALTLLARNPSVFGYAASWDAPLLLDYRELWGIAAHFGDADTFQAFQPLRLLLAASGASRAQRRFALLGRNLFGPWPGDEFAVTPHTVTAHQRLMEQGIPHFYDQTLEAAHHWEGDWVAPAVAVLIELSRPPEPLPFRCDMEAQQLTKPALDAVTQGGGWIIGAARDSVIVAGADGEHALLARGRAGKIYSFTLWPGEPLDLSAGAELHFRTALHGGYGAEGRGYGGNRNHILEGRDACGRPLFRLLLVGYTEHGRLGYLDARNNWQLWEPRLRRLKNETFAPDALHEVQLLASSGGIEVELDGTLLPGPIPYDLKGAAVLHDLRLYGTDYAASAFFDDFHLQQSSKAADDPP